MNSLKEWKIKLSDYSRRLTREQLILILAIVAGLIIRVYFSYVYPLWNDEAITANAAIALKNTGLPVFPSAFEYWRSFPFTFAVGISALLLGSSEIALRVPAMLFSILTIIMTFKIADKMYNSSVGLIASIMLSFSLWHIAWSTQVRAYIMFQLLYLAAILLIYKFEEASKVKHLYILGVLTVLAAYTHKTGYILPFIFLIYLTCSYMTKKRFKDVITAVLISIISIFIFFFVTPSSIGDLLAQLSFQEINLRLYYNLIFSRMPLVILLSLTGIFIGIRDNIKATFLLSISIFPAVIVYVFFVDGATSRYLFFALPIISIWTALSIEKLSLIISNLISREIITPTKIMLLFTLILLIFGVFNNSVDDFRPDTPDKTVYSHLENNAYQNDVIVTQWTPAMVYYYRPPDYVLYGDRESLFLHIRKDHNYKGKELYAGAEFVNDSQGFKAVVNNNSRGWLVLRDNSYERKRTEIKDIISNFTVVGEYDGYKMWKWNNSITYRE